MNTLSAIIFDFDGVIADTEPLHFAGFRQTLAEIGIGLTESDYYANYLGYDDRGCFLAALTAHQRPTDLATITALMQRKAQAYLESVKGHLVIFPGVRELVQEAAATYPLAIASGALRHEIEFILEQAGLRKEFLHITGAEDVTKGKPDPEPFLHALDALNRQRPKQTIAPESCLVIEDSIPGLRGAKTAGMKVLAVANTHTIQDLHEAHAITPSLTQIRLSELRERLWPVP
ncbi:MAG: HAD family phosphatase [Nitrospirota bacterium]|nr:HAD family phosphatase [Nitrospirota bacterium]MDP2384419.1 HAD family phosphatase [Nitrospirota bacterium]MDP3596211.1 HAD family phosphatase [Nitrospirota bacterium]